MRGVAWRGVAWRGVAWRGVAWRASHVFFFFDRLYDEGDVALLAREQNQCRSVCHVTFTTRMSETKNHQCSPSTKQGVKTTQWFHSDMLAPTDGACTNVIGAEDRRIDLKQVCHADVRKILVTGIWKEVLASFGRQRRSRRAQRRRVESRRRLCRGGNAMTNGQRATAHAMGRTTECWILVQ